MIVLTALLSIAILIAFFYLVHLVSHIKNILQYQIYWDLRDRGFSDRGLEDLRIKGVITRVMEKELKKKNVG